MITVMKKTILILISVFCALAAAAEGRTYYVSASGDDGASGLTEATAWKSLDKINSSTFSPGDRILLRGGDTWHGQLRLNGSGNGSKQAQHHQQGQHQGGKAFHGISHGLSPSEGRFILLLRKIIPLFVTEIKSWGCDPHGKQRIREVHGRVIREGEAYEHNG